MKISAGILFWVALLQAVVAGQPDMLPAVGPNSAKGLRLECRPIAATFTTDQRVGVSCRVFNTSGELKPVRWSINGGNNFCLTPASKPVGSGGLLPQPLPSLNKSYVIKDAYPPFTQKILYLPPGEVVEFHLDCGYFERPQTFHGRIVYDPLSPRGSGWISTNSDPSQPSPPPWTNELAVSEAFVFEVVGKEGFATAGGEFSGNKNPSVTFGPVQERVIEPTNPDRRALNLAFGNFISPGPGRKLDFTEAGTNTLRAAGADLYAQDGAFPGVLTTLDLRLCVSSNPTKPEDFDNLTAAQLEQLVAQMENWRENMEAVPMPGMEGAFRRATTSIAKDSLYVFVTRNDVKGALQISDDPRGVKLRYKLVQKP